MNTINYNALDFTTLKKIENENNSNQIYIDNSNKLIYKIFNNTNLLKEKKINLLQENLDFNHVTNIESLIKDKQTLKGIVLDYIPGITLVDYYLNASTDDFLKLIIQITKELQKIHKSKVLIGDMHFENILITNNNYYLLDVDSFGIYKFLPENIPLDVYNFCNYMNYRIDKNQNLDRLGFILNFYRLIFQNNIYNVSEKQYDSYTEKYEFLSQLKEVFLDLKYSYKELPPIPYIHEVLTKYR